MKKKYPVFMGTTLFLLACSVTLTIAQDLPSDSGFNEDNAGGLYETPLSVPRWEDLEESQRRAGTSIAPYSPQLALLDTTRHDQVDIIDVYSFNPGDLIEDDSEDPQLRILMSFFSI